MNKQKIMKILTATLVSTVIATSTFGVLPAQYTEASNYVSLDTQTPKGDNLKDYIDYEMSYDNESNILTIKFNKILKAFDKETEIALDELFSYESTAISKPDINVEFCSGFMKGDSSNIKRFTTSSTSFDRLKSCVIDEGAFVDCGDLNLNRMSRFITRIKTGGIVNTNFLDDHCLFNNCTFDDYAIQGTVSLFNSCFVNCKLGNNALGDFNTSSASFDSCDIGVGVFKDSKKLQNVVIYNSIIGDSAFENCSDADIHFSYINSTYDRLRDVTIGAKAFVGVKSCTSIPPNVKSIDNTSFDKEVYSSIPYSEPVTNVKYDEELHGFDAVYNEQTNEYYVTSYSGDSKNMMLPSTIKGKNVIIDIEPPLDYIAPPISAVTFNDPNTAVRNFYEIGKDTDLINLSNLKSLSSSFLANYDFTKSYENGEVLKPRELDSKVLKGATLPEGSLDTSELRFLGTEALSYSSITSNVLNLPNIDYIATDAIYYDKDIEDASKLVTYVGSSLSTFEDNALPSNSTIITSLHNKGKFKGDYTIKYNGTYTIPCTLSYGDDGGKGEPIKCVYDLDGKTLTMSDITLPRGYAIDNYSYTCDNESGNCNTLEELTSKIDVFKSPKIVINLKTLPYKTICFEDNDRYVLSVDKVYEGEKVEDIVPPTIEMPFGYTVKWLYYDSSENENEIIALPTKVPHVVDIEYVDKRDSSILKSDKNLSFSDPVLPEMKRGEFVKSYDKSVVNGKLVYTLDIQKMDSIPVLYKDTNGEVLSKDVLYTNEKLEDITKPSAPEKYKDTFIEWTLVKNSKGVIEYVVKLANTEPSKPAETPSGDKPDDSPKPSEDKPSSPTADSSKSLGILVTLGTTMAIMLSKLRKSRK